MIYDLILATPDELEGGDLWRHAGYGRSWFKPWRGGPVDGARRPAEIPAEADLIEIARPRYPQN